MSNAQTKAVANFTIADIQNMISVVHNFTRETSQLYNAYNNAPSPNSIAIKEISSFPNPEPVETVHYSGLLSMEAAADHLMVFADSFAEPAKSVAPWTCVRGLLESCALASWFLDPTIDVRTRVGRQLAFRYVGFTQQIKIFNVDGRQKDIDQVNQRIKKVQQDAINLGYSPILNKAGKIDGIGQRMPDITTLVSTVLNREVEYRLLSAIAHGHHWATHQVGFRVIEITDAEGQIGKGLEKHLDPVFVLYAANIAVTSFAQVLWDIWRLYGWDEQEIKTFLDGVYDRLNYNKERRLW